jgi:hypothetical protein
MTHVEEEKVTTTYEHEDAPKPKVENINLNVNRGDNGETVSIDTPDEPIRTHTETTHTEVRESD